MNGMPPFAFPPMPPMIFTPPPTIPANLDQLTDEELHALEGNERQHVEERLKVCTNGEPRFLEFSNSISVCFFLFILSKNQLLKNIQTMMDASVSLMNQYMMVVNRMPAAPPIPATPSSSSSSSSPSNVTATETQPAIDTQPVTDTQSTTDPQSTATNASTTSVPSVPSMQPNESAVTRTDDSEAGPSTCHKAKSIETYEIDGNTVTIEDVGPNDPHDTNDTQTELRRRRLQRFDIKSEDS